METSTKTCSKCGEEKNLSNFPKDKTKRDGCRANCKECDKVRYKLRAKVEIPLNPSSDFTKRGISLYQNLGRLNNDDIQFLKKTNISQEMLKMDNDLKNPPTNVFKILDVLLQGESTVVNISILKSKLSIFLMQEKNMFNVDFTIFIDDLFDMNRLLVVSLPETIMLSNDEINNFVQSFIKTQKDKFSSVNIILDDVDISPFVKEIPHLIQDFLLTAGHNVNRETVSIYVHNFDNFTFSWSEKHSISKDILDTLKEKIIGFMIELL